MPKQHKPLPSLAVVYENLKYDPSSGVFTWAKDQKRSLAGEKAGRKIDGYIVIPLNGSIYYAHRLAWLYATGKDPGNLEIDHRNNKRQDNAIDNLRLATALEQGWNSVKPNNNTSGSKGLYWCNTKKIWVGEIECKRKRFRKRSQDRKLVEKWLIAKRRELHGDFAKS